MIFQIVLLPVFVSFLITFRYAESRGVLYIKLNEFYNPLGRTYQGYCCDIGYVDADGVCIDQCDYVMRLIVSGLGRANDHVFLFHRPLKYDSNNVVFKQNDTSLVLTVLFDRWPHTGRVQMNAFFYDYDDYDHTTTLVDWFETDLLPREESIQRDTGRHARGYFQSQVVRGNRKDDQTELTFQWSALCDEGSECFQSGSLADDLSQYNNFPFFEEFGEMNGFESAYEYKVPRIRRKSTKKLNRYQRKKLGAAHDEDTQEFKEFKGIRPKYQKKELGSKSFEYEMETTDIAGKKIPKIEVKRLGRIESRSRLPTKRKEDIKPLLKDTYSRPAQSSQKQQMITKKKAKYLNVAHGGNNLSHDLSSFMHAKKMKNLPHKIAIKRQDHANDFDIINDYESTDVSGNQHNMTLKYIDKERVSDVIAVYGENVLHPFTKTNLDGPMVSERAVNQLYHYNHNLLKEKGNTSNIKDNLVLTETDAPATDGDKRGEKRISGIDSSKTVQHDSPARTKVYPPVKIEGLHRRPSDKIPLNENIKEASGIQFPHDPNRKEHPKFAHNYIEHDPQKLFTKKQLDYILPISSALSTNAYYDVSTPTPINSETNSRQTRKGSRTTFFTIPLPMTNQKNNVRFKYTYNRNPRTTLDSFRRRQEISGNWADMIIAREKTRNIHSEPFIADIIVEGRTVDPHKNLPGENQDSVEESSYIRTIKRGGMRSNTRKSKDNSSLSSETGLLGENLNYHHELDNTMRPRTSIHHQNEHFRPIFEFEDNVTSKSKNGYDLDNAQVSGKLHHDIPSTNGSLQSHELDVHATSKLGTVNQKTKVGRHFAQRFVKSQLKHWVTRKPSSDEGHSKIKEYKIHMTRGEPKVLSTAGYSMRTLKPWETNVHSSTEKPFHVNSQEIIGRLNTDMIRAELTQQRESGTESMAFWAETSPNQQTENDYATEPSRMNHFNPSTPKRSAGPAKLDKFDIQKIGENMRKTTNGKESEFVPDVLLKSDNSKQDFNRDKTMRDFDTGFTQTYKQINLHLTSEDKKVEHKSSNTKRKVYSIDVTMKPVEMASGNTETPWITDFYHKNIINDNEVPKEPFQNRRPHQNHVKRPSNSELLYDNIKKLKSIKFVTAAPVHWYVTAHPAFRRKQRDHGHSLFNMDTQSPSWYDSNTKDIEFVQLKDVKEKGKIENHIKMKSFPDKRRMLSDKSNYHHIGSHDKQTKVPAIVTNSGAAATTKLQDFEVQRPHWLGKKSFHIAEKPVEDIRAPYESTVRDLQRKGPAETQRPYRREQTEGLSRTTPLFKRLNTNDETNSESYVKLISSKQDKDVNQNMELIGIKQVTEGRITYTNSEDSGAKDFQSSSTENIHHENITEERNPTTSQIYDSQTSNERWNVSPNNFSTNVERLSHSRWRLDLNKDHFHQTSLNPIGKPLDPTTVKNQPYQYESKKYYSMWDQVMNFQLGERNDSETSMTGKIGKTSTQKSKKEELKQNLDQTQANEKPHTEKGIFDDQKHRSKEILNEHLQWKFDKTWLGQDSESNSKYDKTAEDASLAHGPPTKPWDLLWDQNRERHQLTSDASRTTEKERKSKPVTRISDTQSVSNVKQKDRYVYILSNMDKTVTKPDVLYHTHQFDPLPGITEISVASSEGYGSPDQKIFSIHEQNSPRKLKNSDKPRTVSDRSRFLDQSEKVLEKLNILDREQQLSDKSMYSHQKHVPHDGDFYSDEVLKFPFTPTPFDQGQGLYESSLDSDRREALHEIHLSSEEIKKRPDMLQYLNSAQKLTSGPTSLAESEKPTDTSLYTYQTSNLREADPNSKQPQKSTDSSVHLNQEQQSLSASPQIPRAFYIPHTSIENINQWTSKNSLEPLSQTSPVYQVPVPFMSKLFYFQDSALFANKNYGNIQNNVSKHKPSNIDSSTVMTGSLAFDIDFKMTPLTRKRPYINTEVTSKSRHIRDRRTDNFPISTMSEQYKNDKGVDFSNKEDIIQYPVKDVDKSDSIDVKVLITDPPWRISTDTRDQPDISFMTQGSNLNVTEPIDIIPTTYSTVDLFQSLTETPDYSLALETVDSYLSYAPYPDQKTTKRDLFTSSYNPLLEIPRKGETQNKSSLHRTNQNTDISLGNMDRKEENAGRKMNTQEDSDKKFRFLSEFNGIHHEFITERTHVSNSKPDNIKQPTGSTQHSHTELPTSKILSAELGYTSNFKHNGDAILKSTNGGGSHSYRLMDDPTQLETHERQANHITSIPAYTPEMNYSNKTYISGLKNKSNAGATADIEDSSSTQSTTFSFGYKSNYPSQSIGLHNPIEVFQTLSAQTSKYNQTPNPIIGNNTSGQLFDRHQQKDETQVSESLLNISDILSQNDSRNRDTTSSVLDSYINPRNDLSPTAQSQTLDSSKLGTTAELMITQPVLLSKSSETQPWIVSTSRPHREVTNHTMTRTTKAIEYTSDVVTNENLQGNKIRKKEDILSYPTKRPQFFGLLSDLLEFETPDIKEPGTTMSIDVKTPSSTEDLATRPVNIENVSFAKQIGIKRHDHKHEKIDKTKNRKNVMEHLHTQYFKRPYIRVPYLGLKNPPPKPSSHKPFVPELNIPLEMKALPELGFILQTLHPHLNIQKHTIRPADPNSIKLTKIKRTRVSRLRDINVDKYRDFVYNIRHGPKVEIPLQGLYSSNEMMNATSFSGAAHELPQQGRHEGVQQVNFRSVEKVFTRYWPAVLGVTIGTIFLLAGLATSLWCKQHRMFMHRARWTDSPQHLSEPPDTSEYATSSAASLTSDLARSSVNLV